MKEIKQYTENNLNERCLIPVIDDKKQIELEFNRAVFKFDLRCLKYNRHKLSVSNIKRLDNYFETMSAMTGYDAEPFKAFFRNYVKEDL